MIKFILKNRLAVFVYFQYWMFYFSVLHSDGSPLMSAGSGMVDFVVSDRRVFLFLFLLWVSYIKYRGVLISSRETAERKDLANMHAS